MFVGENFDEGNAFVKCDKATGIVSLDEIRKHRRSLRCVDESQLNHLMDVLEKIELCLRVRCGSASDRNINNSNKDGYLFPCLLPTMSETDRKNRWLSIVSDFPSNMYGRRFQCENKVDHLPSGFFPTLLHRILIGMRELVVQVKLNVCFLRDNDIGGCLMVYLDAEVAGEPRFIDLVCCGSSRASVSLLERVFDVCESILCKYEGLSVSRFALCTRCLCSTKTDHCLSDNSSSRPLLCHKKMDESKVKKEDRCDLEGGPPHHFDCWSFSPAHEVYLWKDWRWVDERCFTLWYCRWWQ